MTFSFSDSSFASAITPWLPVLDAVLKSTILLALAALCSVLLRGASAATRHLVWTLGLVSALLLPALSLALPRWQMPLITVATPQIHAADEGAQAPALHRSAVPRANEREAETAPSSAIAGPVSSNAVSTSIETSLPAARISWQALLLSVWAAGVLAIFGRLVVGLLAVQWMSRRTEHVTDAPWLPLARDLAEEIGVRADLTFLRSPRATMPMAWGMMKPSVLMPADADEWPLERLRIVLLHELAHVKRRDCLTHALAQIVCAVYWFNPLAWMAARHVRTERERACDDLVLALGTRGSDYADQLLEIARVMRSGRFPVLLTGATLAMAHRSQLEGRLIAILDPRVPRAGVSRVRSAGATALVVCALLPLASLQPWAHVSVQQPVEVSQPTPVPTVTPAPIAQPSAAPTPYPQEAPRPQPRPEPQLSTTRENIAAAAAQAAVEIAGNSASQSVAQDAVQGAIQGVIAGRPGFHAGQGSSGQQGKADPRLVSALTAALKDTDVEVREAAMQALIQLRDPSIYEPLVQALRDASADVREHAAMGLAQLRDPRAIEPLTAALKDLNASVREQAVFALGQLRAQGSAPAVMQALKDESPSVRERAASALGQLREPRAVDALIEAMQDTNANVREQAAFALSQISDRRAVAALTAALSDSSDSVREQVVFALGQLRDPSAVDALVTALRDKKPDIREQAAFALGQIRDPRGVAPLVAALKDADAEVRHNAAFALSQIGDRSAVEALVFAMKDTDAEVRAQVAFALGQLRDPRAIDVLTAALKDTNAQVRQQAAFALGQLAR
jgi:HEAT repeat protein/beta-lactamase regulating signal transducer with metallopeptidase domain